MMNIFNNLWFWLLIQFVLITYWIIGTRKLKRTPKNPNSVQITPNIVRKNVTEEEFRRALSEPENPQELRFGVNAKTGEVIGLKTKREKILAIKSLQDALEKSDSIQDARMLVKAIQRLNFENEGISYPLPNNLVFSFGRFLEGARDNLPRERYRSMLSEIEKSLRVQGDEVWFLECQGQTQEEMNHNGKLCRAEWFAPKEYLDTLSTEEALELVKQFISTSY